MSPDPEREWITQAESLATIARQTAESWTDEGKDRLREALAQEYDHPFCRELRSHLAGLMSENQVKKDKTRSVVSSVGEAVPELLHAARATNDGTLHPDVGKNPPVIYNADPQNVSGMAHIAANSKFASEYVPPSQEDIGAALSRGALGVVAWSKFNNQDVAVRAHILKQLHGGSDDDNWQRALDELRQGSGRVQTAYALAEITEDDQQKKAATITSIGETHEGAVHLVIANLIGRIGGSLASIKNGLGAFRRPRVTAPAHNNFTHRMEHHRHRADQLPFKT